METPIRLFVVDDHVMIRLGIHALISNEQQIILVGEAANGAEALEKFDQLHPDVTIMDGILPDMHGVEVIRTIIGRHPHAKMILTSIHESAEDIHRAMQAGAMGYVTKAQGQESMIKAIRAVAAGHVFLEPELVSRLQARAATNSMSRRENEVLRLVAAGLVNKQIGYELGLSENTVKTHIARIMLKLEVHDRTSLAMKAANLGLLR